MLYHGANSGNKTNLASAFSLANAVWCPEKCWWKWDFSPLPCPGCNPLSPLWRSWAYSFLVWLIGMNGPTCTAFWARLRLLRGSCPLGHHAGHSQGDWWPRLLKCVWGSSSWSCPALCWSFLLTGWASAELLIERLRLTGLCDTSLLIQTGPETHSLSPCTAVWRR